MHKPRGITCVEEFAVVSVGLERNAQFVRSGGLFLELAVEAAHRGDVVVVLGADILRNGIAESFGGLGEPLEAIEVERIGIAPVRELLRPVAAAHRREQPGARRGTGALYPIEREHRFIAVLPVEFRGDVQAVFCEIINRGCRDASPAFADWADFAIGFLHVVEIQREDRLKVIREPAYAS